ncbi:MAG: TIGR03905 family TSCPD domain-containing protein [Bacilli bacterium]|nr:TIGR03905 family TSCPD domain-containing protein [Bacillales bacterium]MDY2574597.1 TIGR03905 family TSCPD domain-containing protein [Bacilli bacterium]
MVKQLVYTPSGVCSRQMIIDYENDKIVDVKVIGGCNGNLQGISKLLVGMDVHEAINRLEGIRCGMKSTSCPDQIAKALKTIK